MVVALACSVPVGCSPSMAMSPTTKPSSQFRSFVRLDPDSSVQRHSAPALRLTLSWVSFVGLLLLWVIIVVVRFVTRLTSIIFFFVSQSSRFECGLFQFRIESVQPNVFSQSII